MEENNFKQILEKLTNSIGIDDIDYQSFYQYMNLLLEWNKKINLTAITEEKEIIIKHFIDSAIINSYIPDNSKLIDVGTGAGFPGIPLKIIRKDIYVTLLDSLNKRINFLNNVIKTLELKGIQPIHGRAEEIAKIEEYREKYDVTTARAVAQLNVLVEYLLPFTKIGGLCICMKGPNILQEIEDSKNAINLLGGRIEKIEELILPGTNLKRNIILIRKEKNTPYKYPRNAGIIKKKLL